MTLLRPWSPADAEDLAPAMNNLNIHRNLRDGIPFPYTVADAEAYIRSVLDAPIDSQYSWAISLEGRPIGSIGLFRQANIHSRTAELGYWLAEPYWGRGIVSQGVRDACAYVFAHTDLLRVYAEPFATNAASCRVLENAGFQLEGILRRNAVKNGQILDMKLYARLRD